MHTTKAPLPPTLTLALHASRWGHGGPCDTAIWPPTNTKSSESQLLLLPVRVQVDWRVLQQGDADAWLELVQDAFDTLDQDKDGIIKVRGARPSPCCSTPGGGPVQQGGGE